LQPHSKNSAHTCSEIRRIASFKPSQGMTSVPWWYVAAVIVIPAGERKG